MMIAFFAVLFFFSAPPPFSVPAQVVTNSLEIAPKPALTDSLVNVYNQTLLAADRDFKEADRTLMNTSRVIKETGEALNQYVRLPRKTCIIFVKDTTIVVGKKDRTWFEKLRSLNFKKTKDITKDTIVEINK